MIARAEARAHDAVGDRLAHQELLRALAGLVVVVDDVVVGRLVAIELACLAAGRQRGEQHVALAAVVDVLVLAGEQHLERIAGLNLALEIDVVGVDADQIVDHRARHLVAQRGLVDALVEPHALAVVLLVVVRAGATLVGAARVDRDVFALVGQRDDRLDRAVAGDDDADRLQPLAAARRREQDAQLLAFLGSGVAAARSRSAAVIALMSSGVAPRSRRFAETESPFLSTIVRSLQALPPVVWVVVLGSSVMFSGTMRGSKPA